MMDMHNLVSKLVTYSTLGLVRDRNKKQREDKRSQSPSSVYSSDVACFPTKQASSPIQRGNSTTKVTTRVNRSEAKRSGNLSHITSSQALSGAAHAYYRNTTPKHDTNHHPLHGLYIPDVVVRHGSMSSSDEYISAQASLRTVCIA
ncbi:hypothetical protein CLIB1423_02S08350 [[Candida] railenensis]|uniref:Uncharacterized protein n=1 Tax=[Candida] railenensis TaxID=45579 RepID=A0A9P0QM53_9ASCO|nr:hypothetical protein CLIB1423_02S08350 [[Candida] railenensis]